MGGWADSTSNGTTGQTPHHGNLTLAIESSPPKLQYFGAWPKKLRRICRHNSCHQLSPILEPSAGPGTHPKRLSISLHTAGEQDLTHRHISGITRRGSNEISTSVCHTWDDHCQYIPLCGPSRVQPITWLRLNGSMNARVHHRQSWSIEHQNAGLKEGSHLNSINPVCCPCVHSLHGVVSSMGHLIPAKVKVNLDRAHT